MCSALRERYIKCLTAAKDAFERCKSQQQIKTDSVFSLNTEELNKNVIELQWLALPLKQLSFLADVIKAAWVSTNWRQMCIEHPFKTASILFGNMLCNRPNMDKQSKQTTLQKEFSHHSHSF